MLQTTPTIITTEHVTENFIRELKEAFPVGDEDKNPQWYQEKVTQFVNNAKNLFMVAYSNGHVVAFLHGHEYDRLDDKKEFFLYEAGTRKEFRNMGVMSSLLTALFSILKSRGFQSVWVLTNKSNEAAVKTYQKAGMKAPAEDDQLYEISL